MNDGIGLTSEQRDMLLNLHRTAMKAEFNLALGNVSPQTANDADDAFRKYLFFLETAA